MSFLHSPPNNVEYGQLGFEKLHQQDLTGFDCTDNGRDEQGLQTFIQKEALPFQTANLGKTYVVLFKGKMIAYLTVAMAGISVSRMKGGEKVEGVEIQNYPALLLGRLAVDNRFWGKDVGSYVCTWCLGLARKLSGIIGCRYVVLHAREAVVPFYIKNGFTVSDAETGPTKLLYRKIA